MKLITKNGSLDLPEDFSMTIEKTNPFLSGDGDTSMPITLPATKNNLAILGHLERIDRSGRFYNKVPAILQIGAIQKQGQLVIDTINSKDGIDVSFAIDNSDLYVKSKSKTLKEIFSEYNNGAGYKITYGTMAAAITEMENIYNNGNAEGDFVVFPVAVSPFENDDDKKTIVYQYNNEDDLSGNHHLVYRARQVREGNVSMMVPEGYGIAPFLKLQKLLVRLFECLGYTVEYNCFDEIGYNEYVVVHNCSDCLCTPGVVLNYCDMVPSCTLSEFLNWLLAKFMVQPVVNSESHRVRIVSIQVLLNQTLAADGGFDFDISGTLEGDWTVQMNPSKRLVLAPTNDIEGTEPAAETLDELVANYGSYVIAGEKAFNSLFGNSPQIFDCLFLRISTGMFYLLERNLGTGKMEMRQLGTNHFAYDRKNSDEIEQYTQKDSIPLMICNRSTIDTAPYIGERIHRHTSSNGSLDETEQKIVVVQAHTNPYFFYPTTGSTQKRIFLDRSHQGNIDLYYDFHKAVANNYDGYSHFFSNYNNILLNNPVHFTGRVKLPLNQFLSLDMSAQKLCNGQRLLPVKASVKINGHANLTEMELIKKDCLNGIHDQSIPYEESTPLKWAPLPPYNDYTIAYTAYLHIFTDGSGGYTPDAFEGYEVDHGIFKDVVWLGRPKELGETKSVEIKIEITLKIDHEEEVGGAIVHRHYLYKPSGKYKSDGQFIDELPSEWVEQLAFFQTYGFEAVLAT